MTELPLAGIKVIDFTGSSANGEWLEKNARQAQVYTEKAGVNQIVVDERTTKWARVALERMLELK